MKATDLSTSKTDSDDDGLTDAEKYEMSNNLGDNSMAGKYFSSIMHIFVKMD